MLSTRFTVISSTSAFSIFDCSCCGWHKDVKLENTSHEVAGSRHRFTSAYTTTGTTRRHSQYWTCNLTSASAIRSLSSCKLSLMRARLFFSTRGFLTYRDQKHNTITLDNDEKNADIVLITRAGPFLTFLSDLIPVQSSSRSIPLVLLRMGAMLSGVEPGCWLTGGWTPPKKSR